MQAALAAAGTPVLVIHGEADGVTPLAGAQRLCQNINQGVTDGKKRCNLVVIQEAAHNLQMEQPEEVAKAIQSFVAE